jgi:hypothetical protein
LLRSRARPFAPPDPSAKDWPDGNRRQQAGDDEQHNTSSPRPATPEDRQQNTCGHRRNRQRVIPVEEDPLPRRQRCKLFSSPRGSEPFTLRLLFGSRVPLGRRHSQPLPQSHRRDRNESQDCERQCDRETQSHSARLRAWSSTASIRHHRSSGPFETPPGVGESTFPAVIRAGAHDDSVPRISFFYGIAITMYFYDHDPPHFHAQYAEHHAVIAIESGKVLLGSLPAGALKLVGEWAGCTARSSKSIGTARGPAGLLTR